METRKGVLIIMSVFFGIGFLMYLIMYTGDSLSRLAMMTRQKVLIITSVCLSIGFIIYLILYEAINCGLFYVFVLPKFLSKTASGYIFFLETSNKNVLRGRAACAVESAAKIHPEHNILVMHLEPKWNNDDQLTLTLKNYSNVLFQPINLTNILFDTIIEPWVVTRPWNKSNYKIECLSDILRLILLLKNGGIYLDSDVIVMKSLAHLRNTAGSSSPNIFSNGVMMFDKGNSFFNATAHELTKVTNWNVWGTTGPLLYTKVLLEKCHVPNLVSLRNISHCNEIDVPTLLSKAFYPIHYSKWKMYFDPKEANATLALVKNSYLVHYWNKFSTNEPIIIGSGQPIELLAKKFCPNVYKITKQSKGIL